MRKYQLHEGPRTGPGTGEVPRKYWCNEQMFEASVLGRARRSDLSSVSFCRDCLTPDPVRLGIGRHFMQNDFLIS